jgi:hypothetical protein
MNHIHHPILIFLFTISLHLFAMEMPHINQEQEYRYCKKCKPCSQYKFCPDPYNPTACNQRIECSKQACLLCIAPAGIIKTITTIHYYQQDPTHSCTNACSFALTGGAIENTELDGKTRLCCFFTDGMLATGGLLLCCAINPCINEHGWNCCIKKDQSEEEIIINNNEDLQQQNN